MAADTQLPVTVSDLEVAQRIAGAARSGRRADREPPLEQLLGAFGETEPSAEARARVASALTLAGLRTRPTVHEAHPGERVKLMVPGGGPNLRLIAAAIVLVLALGATALVAALGGGKSRQTTGKAPVASAPVTTTAAPPPTTTAAASPPKQQKQAKPRKKAKPRPPAPRVVVVKLVPGPQASYLCVDNGPGTKATETTLAAPLTLRGRRVRINVGLSSVNVTVNGRRFALAGSPSGYDIGLKRRVYLPQGQRPCA